MSEYRFLRGQRQAIDILAAVLRDWDLRPFPNPPEGQRYKRLAEYRQEFNDAATTAARRQELVAIRCGLRAPETVPIEQP